MISALTGIRQASEKALFSYYRHPFRFYNFRASKTFTFCICLISQKSWTLFLAAISSSRSDVVTNSVRSFVRPFVMKEFFFSIKSYNGVSRKSKGCFNEVWRMLLASLMDRKFQGCFEGVSRVFQRSSKDDSRKS